MEREPRVGDVEAYSAARSEWIKRIGEDSGARFVDAYWPPEAP